MYACAMTTFSLHYVENDHNEAIMKIMSEFMGNSLQIS